MLWFSAEKQPPTFFEFFNRIRSRAAFRFEKTNGKKRPRLFEKSSGWYNTKVSALVNRMKRFIEGENRFQSTLFPESLEDYIAEDNSIRVVDAFVDKLVLKELGFDRAEPSDTGRPGYLPATMLKIYIYGYLNRIQSSRRLDRESYRNVELIWPAGRLMPSFKTIADFRKDI